MATVPRIDVSCWNAGIDWPKVRAAGQRFVLIKTSEGDVYMDPTFDDNWRGAKAAGLLRGAYHFFRANGDAKKQANRFVDYVISIAALASAYNHQNINHLGMGQSLVIPEP